MNLLEKLMDESPPFLVFYLAKENRRHPGMAAIAERSRLSRATIERLAKSLSWAPWRFSVISKFCDALGVSFVINVPSGGATAQPRYYFRKPYKRYLEHLAKRTIVNPLEHLDTNQKRRFFALCKKWKESRG